MAAAWQKEISEYFATHDTFFTNVTYWLKKVPDPVTKTEHKHEKTNFLPSFLSLLKLRIINYWLKYTVEVFSTGTRPEEEGELCDLLTYKLLTPSLSPGCLPESSQKPRAKHHIWTLSVWPRHVLSLEVRAWMSAHLGEGPREKAGRDERYWGWIVSMIKIKHTPWTFSPSHILPPPPPVLPLSLSLHSPKIGELINKWETCWQQGAKWIWVMGSWSMCLFNHLVATPSVLW